MLIQFLANYSGDYMKEMLMSNEKYKSLKKYFILQTYETTKLINLYFEEMAAIQMSMSSSEHGKLYCMAYYHAKNESLIVQGNQLPISIANSDFTHFFYLVIKCKNLIAMDKNGLSDPVNKY